MILNEIFIENYQHNGREIHIYASIFLRIKMYKNPFYNQLKYFYKKKYEI